MIRYTWKTCNLPCLEPVCGTSGILLRKDGTNYFLKQSLQEMAQEQGTPETVKVMFVCLGNICRSPLAEGVFREQVRRAGLADRFEIASSGTGSWHMGDPPDARMQKTARARELDISDQCAQQFEAGHLKAYDHIFVMDKSNLHDVLFFDADDVHGGKVRLFREFDPEPGDYQVPDPYQGGREGFEHVYEIAERTARRLLEALVEEYDMNGRREERMKG